MLERSSTSARRPRVHRIRIGASCVALSVLLLLVLAPLASGAATRASGVWVVPGNTANTITWEPGAGNTAHRIYRSTSSGTLGSLIATVNMPSTSWVDSGLTNGTSYYYTVRGYDGAVESADPLEQMVSTGTSFPAGRWWDDCVGVLNGKLFVFGGYQGGSNDTNLVYAYDSVTNTQSTSAFTTPTDRYWCGAERINGKLYLAGGGNGSNGATLYSNILRFDPTAGFSVMATALPTTRYQQSAQAIADGTMLIVGGQNGSTLYGTTLRYDPIADPGGTTSSVLGLTYPNAGIGTPATAAVDGNLYLSGGNIVGSGAMKPGLRHKKISVTFGPDTFTESDPGDLPSTRLGAGVAALNDRVYSVGGATYASEASACGAFSCAVTNSILAWDPRSNAWSTLTATAPTARMRRSAQQIKGFIYVVGGNDGSTLAPGGFDAAIYRFDPGGQARGTPSAPRFATAPTALVGTASNRRAILSWTAGTTVDRYRVFRSTVSGELGTLIEENAGGIDAPNVTVTDYTLTNGTTYYYTVTGVGYDGHETAATSQVAVTPYATGDPTALNQFRSDGTTAIATGAVTMDGITNNVVLTFMVSHPYSGRTVTPWVEVSTTGAFMYACGSNVAGVTFSGAAVSTPVALTSYAATVNLTGLAQGTSYYWRACTVDDLNVEGDWVARGGAPDFRTNGGGVAVQVTPAADAWVGSDTPTLTAQHTDTESDTGQLRFEVCTTSASDPWSSTCGGSYQRFDSPSGIAAGANATYTPTRPLPEGDSYWRVRSTDSRGVSGPWVSRRVRVDLTAPTTPSNVAVASRGAGRVDVTWTASTDAGSGGITYDVEFSTDGTTFSTLCSAIAVTTCSRTGLGNKAPAVMRVRSCDAVGNCTLWQGRVGVSADGYNLRSSVASARLTNAANKQATLASATDNVNTSVTHGTTTGWFPIRPAIAGSTTNVGAAEPANTPYTNPTGAGWVIDDTTGKALSTGDIALNMTVNSSSATGVGDIQCRAYRVVSAAGTISSFTFIGKNTVGVDVLSGTANTARSCTAGALASQTQLAANESIYIELWLRVTTAGAAGASVSLHVEGNQSVVSIPPPGVSPNTPTQVAPADTSGTGLTPTLTANYTHSMGDDGFLEFELATTNGFGATIIQSGSSARRATTQNGTLNTGPLTQTTTYYWRVRAVDVAGLASGWSPTWSFTTSTAPNRPTNTTPVDGTSSGSLTPALTATAFSDVDGGDTHGASEWQVIQEGDSFASPAFTSGVTGSSLTSWTTPALTPNQSYTWRVRYRDSAGLWSSWSIPTQFTATNGASITISVDQGTINAQAALPNTDRFLTFTATVGTTNPTGYQLVAVGSATGTLGADCGGCTNSLADWTNINVQPLPQPWGLGVGGYTGITVRSALGGRMAKWGTGTGTAETDVANNKYSGLDTLTPLVLHDRATAAASDPVVMTWRADTSSTTSPGAHVETISLLATANP